LHNTIILIIYYSNKKKTRLLTDCFSHFIFVIFLNTIVFYHNFIAFTKMKRNYNLKTAALYTYQTTVIYLLFSIEN
ncbi:hypothetical protein DXB51_27230, partial [Bacillus cereus]